MGTSQVPALLSLSLSGLGLVRFESGAALNFLSGHSMQAVQVFFLHCTGIVRGLSPGAALERPSVQLYIYRTLSLRRVIYGYSTTAVPVYRTSTEFRYCTPV